MDQVSTQYTPEPDYTLAVEDVRDEKDFIQFQKQTCFSREREYPKATIPSKRGVGRPHVKKEPLKRNRGLVYDDHASNDEASSGAEYSRPTSSRGEKGEHDSRSFACPFYRLCPLEYLGCVNITLMRIRDVKQHIQRRHSQVSFYCPTCWEHFSSPSRRDNHIRSRNCVSLAPPTLSGPKGISREAQAHLKKKSNRTLAPSEQWYEIWDIIFGDEPRPSKPHLDSVLEETLNMIRDFWKEEGHQVVLEFLHGKQVQPRHGDNLVLLLTSLFEEARGRFKEKARQSGSMGRRHHDSGSVHGSISPQEVPSSPAECPTHTSQPESANISPGFGSCDSWPGIPASFTNEILPESMLPPGMVDEFETQLSEGPSASFQLDYQFCSGSDLPDFGG